MKGFYVDIQGWAEPVEFENQLYPKRSFAYKFKGKIPKDPENWVLTSTGAATQETVAILLAIANNKTHLLLDRPVNVGFYILLPGKGADRTEQEEWI